MKKKYIYADGQVLAQHDVPDNNEKYFYLHDRLDSVRLVIDDTGAAKNSYTYNPFGEMFPTECNETVTNPFKFTGQFYDSEISQYYLRARMYDPQLMRFTSRDPVSGKFREPMTLHKYLYCLNDPVDYTDPTGESLLVDVLLTTSIWAAENAPTLAVGALAMIYTNALVHSSAYQQISLAFAASASDATRDLGHAMAAQWNKMEKMIYNHNQQYKDNWMGNLNLPPGTAKIITIASVLLYAAYEFGDDVVEYIESYREYFEKWLYGNDTPSVTTPPPSP